MAKDDKLVSVIIQTFNRKDKLSRLIMSIKESNYKELEIIVIDDCSTDGTMNLIKNTFPDVTVVRNNAELETPTCRNLGAELATGSFLFFIDDDNIVDRDAITQLVRTISKENRIAVLGPLAYYYSNKNLIWCAGTKRCSVTQFSEFVGHNELNTGKYSLHFECDEFPNAFLVRHETFNIVGGFDALDFPSQLSEGDFCARIKKYIKGKVVLEPKAIVWHDTPIMAAYQAFSRKKSRSSLDYQWEKARLLLKKRNSSLLSFVCFTVLVEPFYVGLFVILVLGSRQGLGRRFQSISRMFRGMAEVYTNLDQSSSRHNSVYS